MYTTGHGEASTFAFQPWWSVRVVIPTFDVVRCSCPGSTFCFYLLQLGLAVTGSSGWKFRNADIRCVDYDNLGCSRWIFRFLFNFNFIIHRCCYLSSRDLAFTSLVIVNEWLCPFYSTFFNIHRSRILTALGCCTWNSCRLGASSVYTIQPCTSLQCHFFQSHIGRVHACVAVTCQLYLGQNDRNLF